MNKLLLFLLMLVFVTSCSPAPEPAPISNDASLSAVATIDRFYTLINMAQAENDFGKPWDMLSFEDQCNARYQCNLDKFQARWWPSKVFYRLYDCGSNTVMAAEMRYPRDTDPSTLPAVSQYWTYELIDSDGTMLIGKTRLSQAPGDGCILAIEFVGENK